MDNNNVFTYASEFCRIGVAEEMEETKTTDAKEFRSSAFESISSSGWVSRVLGRCYRFSRMGFFYIQ